MDQREVIEIVKRYKRLLSDHLQIERVYLFGSYASGSNNEESDIDVAVVMNNVPEDFFAVNPLLWRLRREVDDRIEPILIDPANDESNFLTVVETNGIEII